MAGNLVNKFQMLTADAVRRWFFTDPKNAFGVGFFATDAYPENIADGDDGSTNLEIDFGANFKVIGVICEDCQFIQAATDISAQIAFEPNGPLCDLYEQDDPSTEWSRGAIPATGTMAFILTHAFGVRKIRFVLSNPASGGIVPLRVFAFHSGG